MELARHDVRVPAHRLTVIFFPIMLDAEAAGRYKAQNIKETGRKQGESHSFSKVRTTHREQLLYRRHPSTKWECEVGEG